MVWKRPLPRSYRANQTAKDFQGYPVFSGGRACTSVLSEGVSWPISIKTGLGNGVRKHDYGGFLTLSTLFMLMLVCKQSTQKYPTAVPA